jgi:L-amino acid N-acyltransferase YncA
VQPVDDAGLATHTGLKRPAPDRALETKEPGRPAASKGETVKHAATLKDGRQVVIRDMLADDFEQSLAFFRDLPNEDRTYLRADVTRPETVRARIVDVETGRVKRLVALDGDRIIADGSLELSGHGWGERVAEIRLIVGRPYQRLQLGSLLARELFFLAAAQKVERIVARFMSPQEGARRMLQRLGFDEEFTIPDQVLDQQGRWQDVVIMRCNLEALWQKVEAVLDHEDWKAHYGVGRE